MRWKFGTIQESTIQRRFGETWFVLLIVVYLSTGCQEPKSYRDQHSVRIMDLYWLGVFFDTFLLFFQRGWPVLRITSRSGLTWSGVWRPRSRSPLTSRSETGAGLEEMKWWYRTGSKRERDGEMTTLSLYLIESTSASHCTFQPHTSQ